MLPVILASGSAARKKMLQNAGVQFEQQVAKVDEAAIINSLLAEQAKPRDIADVLAEHKAMRIGSKIPDALVIGSDQILVCENEVFQKPTDLSQAKENLLKLSGKSHQLLSAAVIYEDHKPVWRHIGRAQLIMRELSKSFIDDYLDEQGDDILSCVGCYKIEGQGIQLFNHIQGDYFTILGLPLLDVLGYLRTRGVLKS